MRAQSMTNQATGAATRTASPPADRVIAPRGRNQAPSRIWLILGDKGGDNAQVRIVADTLGWPYTVKQLAFRSPYVTGKPHFRASLYHVDRTQSDPLEPPWPDVILTVGRRPSMVALWVKKQARGRTRLIVIGRPKRWLDRFDLVIAPPQFHLPPRPNVLFLDLPLMRVDQAAVAAEAEAWRARCADLPRPLTAVLVGGPTKPYRFDEVVAAQLMDEARGVVERDGGSLYVTTSRRTPPALIEVLEAGLPAGARLYRWDRGGDNPYRALLGLADRFIVTGDSISMMVEVVRLGKPLAIFALPEHWRLPRLRNALGKHLAGIEDRPANAIMARLGDFLYRLRIAKYARDLSEIHRRLYAQGLAVPLGRSFKAPRARPPDDLARAVERVRALISRPAA
jgi:mitochondrial fission protein ELM1